ncbi:MAG: hypothetical protein AAFX99_16050 [Myxococcota bacterium]
MSGPLDKSELNKQVRLQVLGHPLIVWPSVLGLSLLAGAAAVGSGPLAFVGLVLIASGGLKLSHNWLYKRDTIVQQTLERATAQQEQRAQEALEAQERKLDDLHTRLKTDQDPRTERYLADLRALVDGFRKDRSWMQGLNSHSANQLDEVVQNLFVSCIDRLERTLELQDMIDSISEEAAQQLIESRQALVEEVRVGVMSLSEVLVGVQTLGVKRIAEGHSPGGSVTANAQELQRILQTAQKVEENLLPNSRAKQQEKFRQRLRASREAEQRAVGDHREPGAHEHE